MRTGDAPVRAGACAHCICWRDCLLGRLPLHPQGASGLTPSEARFRKGELLQEGSEALPPTRGPH